MRDAFVRTNRCAIAMMFVRLSVRPSVRLSVTGVQLHYDHTVHFNWDLKLYGWIVQCSGHPDTKVCPPIPSRLWRCVDKCKLSVISQELLKTEVKLLLSANRKSYMKRRSAEQRMNLSGLKRPFHESRAVSAVAELLVYILALQHKVICCGVTSVETQCTLNSMLLNTDKNSERN